MPDESPSGWGTGGGRGEGADPSGWDGFGWAAGTASPRDRARSMFARSVYVGRSAWTAPSIGQRIMGVLVLAMIVGLAVLIIVPAIAIGAVILLALLLYALVRGAVRSMMDGANARSGRKNVRVMTRSGES